MRERGIMEWGARVQSAHRGKRKEGRGEYIKREGGDEEA